MIRRQWRETLHGIPTSTMPPKKAKKASDREEDEATLELVSDACDAAPLNEHDAETWHEWAIALSRTMVRYAIACRGCC